MKLPNFSFLKDVNERRRNVISLSEFGYCAYILQIKWVEIIAIKTERTQIHLLSDVFAAIASLDLKVSISKQNDAQLM